MIEMQQVLSVRGGNIQEQSQTGAVLAEFYSTNTRVNQAPATESEHGQCGCTVIWGGNARTRCVKRIAVSTGPVSQAAAN